MADRPDPEQTIFLVDGTNNLYRAFHAIRDLTNSKGQPTNAIYGFTGMLRKLLKDFAPRYLVVAFDRLEPTFRHRTYPDYKANRPPIPDSLVVQIPYVRQVCDALRVSTLERPGYEADDLIGTLADRARRAGLRAVIVATDKDLLQLVGEGVLLYDPVKESLLDAAAVERVFGVRPEQVPDVLALWGDESDNIPGVPGIGDKGAKDLIRRYGDLEALLRGAPTVTNRRYREALERHADAARLSRDLATVRRDAPVEFDLEALRTRPPDTVAARRLFAELEFNAFLRELPAQGATVETEHEVVLSLEALERLVDRVRSRGRVTLNLERDRREAMRGRLIGIALGGEGAGTAYLPLGHRSLGSPATLEPREVLARLRPLLADARVRRCGHNVKSDLILFRRLGVEVGDYDFDTMLAGYLLNPSRRSHALEVLAQEFAGLAVPTYASLLGEGARAASFEEAGVESAAALACARLAAIIGIEGRLRAALEREGLLRLLIDLELPLCSTLARMEHAGVRIDVPFLERLSRDWERELARLTAVIHGLAGREFNINSPRQLGEILFDTLKLAPGRKTRKTRSWSTDVEVLEELAGEHELPRRLLEYRSLQKLKGTYVDTLPALVDSGTGRVHTSFNQAVAATGRLSSSDPNLQNIPIRTDQGRQIRRAFVPAEGRRLLSADYSQIELRVLAHLSADPAMVDAFRKGEDIHRRTAAELFGVMPALVTGEMRRRAKAVNFGIVYGMGPQRLAREQGVPHKEAEAFIRRYFERFPGVKEYIDRTIARAESEGAVRTLFGRVRYFPEIRGADRNARQQALRAAVNTTIQGTAADLIKKAMVDLSRRLGEEGRGERMIVQVHDELVLEVPPEEEVRAADLVRDVMERVHPLAVPLVVDTRTGANWLEMTGLHGRSKD
jgi:DNA polymerase-1